jgi:hypothetical protein
MKIIKKSIRERINDLPYRTWTHWQWYRDFFKIQVLRYLVTWFAIVPIIANLLIHLPQEVEIGKYKLNMELPFKWECLWISSLLFVMAYGLYAWFCPGFIKKYFSLKQYREMEHSPRWLTWEAKEVVMQRSIVERFVKRMVTKKYIEPLSEEMKADSLPKNVVEELQTVLYFNSDNKSYRFGMPIITEGKEDAEKTEIAVREIFWEIFGRFSSSKPALRIIILVLLFLALLLFLFAIGQNIWAAFSYLFQ